MQQIVEIDNSDPVKARILQTHILKTDQENNAVIAKSLFLDRSEEKELFHFSNCIKFIEKNFAKPYPHLFEYYVSESSGSRIFFVGLKG